MTMQPYPPPPNPRYPSQYVTPVTTVPTSGLATASLVTSLIGLAIGWCTFGAPGVLATILGIAALRETRTGQRGGHGSAVAGIIIGALTAIPGAVFFVMIIAALISEPPV